MSEEKERQITNLILGRKICLHLPDQSPLKRQLLLSRRRGTRRCLLGVLLLLLLLLCRQGLFEVADLALQILFKKD